jgi:8-oxo-dGTP pyrophosphatase MutT (NUDIX family)
LLPDGWRCRIDVGRVRLAFRTDPPGKAAVPVAPAAGRPIGVAERGPAAVLVAIFEVAGEAEVVLTRRSSRLRTHTGEVCFPGGRLEPGETPWQAALREAREEVGLDPARVEALGPLTPTTTVASRAGLFPVAGLLDGPPRLLPNPAEVERAFTVSLAQLMAPCVYHEERWGQGASARAVHFFELPGETIWGATARVLVDLLARVASVPPAG